MSEERQGDRERGVGGGGGGGRREVSSKGGKEGWGEREIRSVL